uniref:Secreted protein n=1 Tax=Mycena chlorophos TaxID=658473 RepID=A0ABQ0L406_MYCCL|nr:predicted protein [Mycena chlorophos]
MRLSLSLIFVVHRCTPLALRPASATAFDAQWRYYSWRSPSHSRRLGQGSTSTRRLISPLAQRHGCLADAYPEPRKRIAREWFESRVGGTKSCRRAERHVPKQRAHTALTAVAAGWLHSICTIYSGRTTPSRPHPTTHLQPPPPPRQTPTSAHCAVAPILTHTALARCARNHFEGTRVSGCRERTVGLELDDVRVDKSCGKGDAHGDGVGGFVQVGGA